MDKQLQKRVKCTILYATETGKSECFAKSLTEIFKHSFNAKVYFSFIIKLKKNVFYKY
jgi:nitric-oxide synthase, brain